MAYFRLGILISTRQEVSLLTQLISHLSSLNPQISTLRKTSLAGFSCLYNRSYFIRTALRVYGLTGKQTDDEETEEMTHHFFRFDITYGQIKEVRSLAQTRRSFSLGTLL